ncbi:helix-turn-helix domain-containing protein [Flavobacterium sp. NRK F10]|uniref:helix-turn-helix domain-containing protein n=1 Tax=Flavobacterium sp. NRK F10 TaxID=2954931 RepID=UPI00209017FD|nr:helix-turn-helix transcriptional regulator [Flavobacterium sp. NRK F10]MCO6174294.1 helix-turn-helix domain-containing protein [Flavobacterium sp. NRK F10]
MEIGTKIRKARESKGLSQEKMADILGISQTKYCRLENNKTFLEWNKIPVLAEALELNITDLFPNENKYYYFHKPSNQSGYIETINYDQKHLTKIEQLYEKLLKEKEELYLKIIEEKNTVIEFLTNKKN